MLCDLPICAVRRIYAIFDNPTCCNQLAILHLTTRALRWLHESAEATSPMPIIKNYGLRWVRDSVNWGARGRAGTLEGKLATLKSSQIVDFREQIGIYVLYEPGFIPVYTGQAGVGTARLFARLKNHQNDHLRDRWDHFSWFGFRAVTEAGELSERQNPDATTSITYADALSEIEGILIEVLEPRLNKQGARWQQNAEEFVQEAAEAPWDKIDDLQSQVSSLQRSIEELIRKNR